METWVLSILPFQPFMISPLHWKVVTFTAPALLLHFLVRAQLFFLETSIGRYKAQTPRVTLTLCLIPYPHQSNITNQDTSLCISTRAYSFHQNYTLIVLPMNQAKSTWQAQSADTLLGCLVSLSPSFLKPSIHRLGLYRWEFRMGLGKYDPSIERTQLQQFHFASNMLPFRRENIIAKPLIRSLHQLSQQAFL